MYGALLAAALVLTAGPAAEARFEANTTVDPHLASLIVKVNGQQVYPAGEVTVVKLATPPKLDLVTAFRNGKRFAQALARFHPGASYLARANACAFFEIAAQPEISSGGRYVLRSPKAVRVEIDLSAQEVKPGSPTEPAPAPHSAMCAHAITTFTVPGVTSASFLFLHDELLEVSYRAPKLELELTVK